MSDKDMDTFGNRIHEYHFNGTKMDSYQSTFNHRDQLTSIKKHNGNISYKYDQNYRLDTKVTTHGTRTFTHNFSYQPSTFSYLPNNATLPTRSVFNNSTTFYEYYPNGNLENVSYSSAYMFYAYDQYNRLVSETNSSANRRWQMTYDSGGNLVSKDVSLRTNGNAVPTESITYKYENPWKDQLTQLQIGNAVYNITYDGAGNPTSWKGQTLSWVNGRQLADEA